MLRSIGAVVAGYATMVIIVMVGTAAWVAARVPGGMAGMRERMKGGGARPEPSAAFLTANLALSLAAALAGGLLTARLAGRAPAGHLVALGLAVLVMGFVSARLPGADRQPGWYRVVIPMLGVAGVALSALALP